MSTTSKGIVYPSDYSEIADIPEVMKDMAESIDGILENQDNKIENKVEKETGKGLSTNDFTNEEKNKLAELDNYDDTEITEDIEEMQTDIDNLKDGVLDLDRDKADKTELPTKTSDLSNDSGFIDNSVNDLTYYYTKTEVDGKVASVYKYKGSVATYQDLPSTSLTIGDVYNVESDGSNYAWTGSAWDKLGGTIDLSGYQEKIDSSHKLSSDLVDDTNQANKFVSASEKQTWNNKSDFSGDYEDLSNKPTIPVVPTNVSAFTNDAGYLTQHQDISGKLDTSKVKNTNSTTAGDVYDVRYINTMLGDIESLLGGI